MKKNLFRTALRILFLQTALLLASSEARAFTVNISPATVSNSYTGTIQLTVSNGLAGASYVVQKFFDANGNSIVDSTDPLVQQFTLTDGQAGLVIGGITDFDVPGDTDGAANGSIAANLRFNNGDFSQNITGQYIYVVSSAGSQKTKTLTVTNVPYPQSITGTVTNSGGTNMPYAVILLFPPPRAGNHGPGSPTAGTVANASGVYTLPVPVGSYTPLAFVSNYVTDSKSAATVTVGASATVSNNLALIPATRTISGTLVDATNGGIVLPGVFEPASANGKIAIGYSDTNGLLTLRVTSATNWSFGSEDKSLIIHGYVGYNGSTNVDTTGGDVTGQTFQFYRATALFYGTVLDASNNPLVGVDVEDTDSTNMFSNDGYTDANGNYVVGAVGNYGPGDTWQFQMSGDTFTNYAFSQPAFQTNGGTTLGVGQAIQANLTGIIATNTISGFLKDSSNNVITNVGISATITTSNNVTFNQSIDTDSNGFFSLSVFSGSWFINVNCNGGGDSVQSFNSNYLCPGSFYVNITNTNVSTNIIVQFCTVPTQILTTNLPNGQVGTPYNQLLSGVTCSGVLNWTVTDLQDFPGTLTLSTNGQIQGTPDTISNYTFTVALDDANGNITNQTLSLNIGPPNFNVFVLASPTNGGQVFGGGSITQGNTNTINATPNSGFVFVNWTSNGVPVTTSNSYSFVVTTNVTFFAHFTPTYTVNLSASPTNGGTFGGGGGPFASNTLVTVNATNNSGFIFTKWTINGVTASTNPAYAFNVTSNVSLVANFTPLYAYNVSASPTNGGTVSASGTNAAGSPITVSAATNPGFVFSHWTSNGLTTVSTTNYLFTLTTNVNLVAIFQPLYVVTVSTSVGGTASPSSTNVSGSAVTVVATNSPGYSFANWTSNSVIVSSTTNYSFTLNTNVALLANFNLAPQSIEVLHGITVLTNNQTNAITFPFVQVTQPGPIVSFTVSNTGGAPLTVSNIVVPTNFVLLTNAPATLTNLPATLPGVTNVSATNGVFAVQLLTSNVGTYTGNVVITNDDTNFTFAISGTVSPSAPAISVSAGTNVITDHQSNAVSFGNTTLNQPGIIKVFTIADLGLQTLNISNIAVSGGYTLVTNAPTNVLAGSNASFAIQLNTSAAGTIAGAVTITNNDTNNNPFVFPVTGFVASKVIALSGTLNFGVVAVNTSSNLNFAISNLGSTNLTVTNITFPAGFVLSWTNGIIAAGSNQVVTVTFSPLAATNYGGTIAVASDATSGNNVLAVSGLGDTSSLFLTVITNGSGTVAPVLTAKALVAGHKYTLTATAKPGNVFSNWTGSVVTNKNPLTFTMAAGTILEANFVTNPFLATKGTYNGLFSATNGQVTEQTAGMLKGLMIGTKGTYGGTLLIGGAGHGFSGTFSLGGQATNKIVRSTAQGGNLILVLTLSTPSNAAPVVSGSITASNWVSTNLTADLATNATFSSAFTMTVPPDTNNPASNSIPVGSGYAVITNHTGSIKITGALADGTAFTQSVSASQTGDVPVYASLYGNKGLLLGWLSLDPANAGSLQWVHPTAKTGLFTNAFVSTNAIALSTWTNPPAITSPPTNLLVLNGLHGVITQTNAYVIAISNNYKIGLVSGPTALSGTLNPKTGLLSLTLGTGETKQTATGVILLDTTNGGGYLLNKTNSAAISLKP